MKIKIIGHRGAAGLELENTVTSLKRASNMPVYAIEIDVRITKDGKLVLCHDGDLQRVANDSRRISNLTLKELQSIPLLDGSRLLTLSQALRVIGSIPVIIEIKDSGSARAVLRTLANFPKAKVRIASFKLAELSLVRSLDSDIFIYLLERTKPFESIQFARRMKLDGVGLNYWLLNPLTYWFAKRSALKMYVYTVNYRPLVHFLGWLYPDVAICTDHPQWFIGSKRRRKK
jgi:glycerophosphoryl diester phosphodiesterase